MESEWGRRKFINIKQLGYYFIVNLLSSMSKNICKLIVVLVRAYSYKEKQLLFIKLNLYFTSTKKKRQKLSSTRTKIINGVNRMKLNFKENILKKTFCPQLRHTVRKFCFRSFHQIFSAHSLSLSFPNWKSEERWNSIFILN